MEFDTAGVSLLPSLQRFGRKPNSAIVFWAPDETKDGQDKRFLRLSKVIARSTIIDHSRQIKQ